MGQLAGHQDKGDIVSIRLVDDWKNVWKYSSTRLAAIGAAIATAGPALDAWNVVPDTLKSMLPAKLGAAMPLVIIFAAIIAARHVTTAAPTSETTNADAAKQ
jgi:hypothetical protein